MKPGDRAGPDSGGAVRNYYRGLLCVSDVDNGFANFIGLQGDAIVVELVQDGGSAGDADNQCSFTYTIYNGITGEQYHVGLDPTTIPHGCIRHGVGACHPATSGVGYYQADGFVLRMFNEKLLTEACEEVSNQPNG